MILAEVGDFSRFDSPDKLLAYAGMSPSTYQSGQLKNCYPHMEKRGSRYLRYALYNATKYVCLWAPTLLHTLQKSGRRANITTLRFLTLPRSWCGLFLLWRNPGSRTARQRKFLLIASTGVLTSSCFAIPFLNHLPFYHIHSFLGLTLNS